MRKVKVFTGADHRGFELKEKVNKWVESMGFEVVDLGAHSLDPGDDYTTYAGRVASSVSEEFAFGILICGSGVGVDVMANKFDGVRSSIGKEPGQVEAGRRDDDMNILVIAADYTSEEEAEAMVRAFLGTDYKQTERFERRLSDITKIEEIN